MTRNGSNPVDESGTSSQGFGTPSDFSFLSQQLQCRSKALMPQARPQQYGDMFDDLHLFGHGLVAKPYQ